MLLAVGNIGVGGQVAGINLISNTVGNYVFMYYLGVAGISLSTSVVYVISTLLIFLSLYKELSKR